MRLIDADELIKSLFKLPPHTFYATEYIKTMVIDEAPTIDTEPAIDAVPVVRCKDCKYFAGKFERCAFNIIVPFDYFFCLHGRREADNEAD